MDPKTLADVTLGDRHRWTGRTRHYAGGRLVERPARLVIVASDAAAGCRLLHLDARGAEMAGSFHATPEDAMDQARWEYEVEAEDWTRPG